MSDEPRFPAYDSPPVTEVVLSVQFETIEGLTPAHLGIWWQENEHRDQYPVCEVRPPLEPVVEQFGGPGRETFSFQVSGGFPVPALWFLTEDRSELLQLQPNRFTRNWTRPTVERPYPSYDVLRPAFESDFLDFRRFLTSQGLPEPTLTQCELTYINPIRRGHVWERHGELQNVLSPWSGEYTDGFLGEPEDLQLSARYQILSDSTPVGRLFVTLQPGFDPQGEAVFLLTLLARGRPQGPGFRGASAFFDLAHEWIVRGFTTLTTQPLHEEWGRTT